MRKPLVVVCVGASAVLLAGAIAATTAGADTTPDTPPPPGLAVPALPSGPTVAAGPAAADSGVPALDLPGLPAAQDGPATGAAGADDPPRRPGGRPTPATGPAHDVPADPVRGKPAADEPTAAPDPDGPAPQQPVRRPAHPDAAPGAAAGGVSSPVQQQALALVNDGRRRGGCDGVTLDQRLIEAAHRHAADMARRGYFAHRSPAGADAGDRVRDTGYRWSRYGENIARGQDSVREVVDGWMHSPEHRANIMDCDLREMGIGLAFASDRTPYWVQNFATPQ